MRFLVDQCLSPDFAAALAIEGQPAPLATVAAVAEDLLGATEVPRLVEAVSASLEGLAGPDEIAIPWAR
jgi:hypothetical protein